ncbi:hypothetical protein MVEN_02235800 [Mycena venus]|uniref:Mitochondrial carrier n=1 Tax=Mycena venus TaxID=2733690 RepID=A0A8H6X7D4_9AGAR|nr:hypothetical protein MVEN_02235800 [Mycena venus]
MSLFTAFAVDIAILLLLQGLISVIKMPFVGVLVRYQANYTPKTGALRLDEEARAPQTDTSIGYFGMMKRVYCIEGCAGLYKGIMPSIMADLFANFVVVVGTVVAALSGVIYYGHAVWWTLYFGLRVIPALLLIPMRIIINRAITTPHRLAAFDVRTALHVLLSPTERAHPLLLYLAPGVAFCLLLTTVLVTPLEVIIAHLTLQHRSGPALLAEVEATPLPPVYSPEPVVEFRGTDTDGRDTLYTGLLDCTRKIVAEEGWSVLTRAWWLIAGAMLVSVLTP